VSTNDENDINVDDDVNDDCDVRSANDVLSTNSNNYELVPSNEFDEVSV
jgi:hypothetical protein